MHLLEQGRGRERERERQRETERDRVREKSQAGSSPAAHSLTRDSFSLTVRS